jgi:hypothetical protein
MGTADGVFNGELALSHAAGVRTIAFGAYKRLVAANDWATPLGVGASIQAFAFGRDEGFYYRSRGVELTVTGSGNPYVEWRVFAERQRGADVEAEFSLASALGDARFPANIVADAGEVIGASVRMHHSLGQDPARFRLLSDARAENGMGDRQFARAMVDITASQGIAGLASIALSVGAGSSTGVVPVQRHFQLGGTQVVRGQRAGVLSGDAFWTGRLEVGTASVMIKPVLFADVGWAGRRSEWSHQGRAASGAGVGVSLFDGVFRVDLARGVHPGRGWRFASYLESRF